MPIYLPSGGSITAAAIESALGYEPATAAQGALADTALQSLTQAAIIAALSTDPVFEGGATFGGPVTSSVSADAGGLGSEVIVATADRDFSAHTGAWTGTGWTVAAGAATHVAGENDLTLNNTALSEPPVVGQRYRLSFRVTTTTASESGIYPYFGGGESVDYYGLEEGTEDVVVHVEAYDDTPMSFIPDDTWEGSIDNVSVKEVLPTALAFFRYDGGSHRLEGHGSNLGLGTVWSQDDEFTATQNVAFGFALYDLTTGYGNAAFGWGAAPNVTTGTLNHAFGYQALAAVATGSHNDAFGRDAGPTTDLSYTFAFGSSANPTASGHGVIGSSNITDTYFGSEAAVSNTHQKRVFIVGTTAPADGDLAANQCALWFDPTDGAAALRIKAKQADGSVKTGTLAVTT